MKVNAFSEFLGPEPNMRTLKLQNLLPHWQRMYNRVKFKHLDPMEEMGHEYEQVLEGAMEEAVGTLSGEVMEHILKMGVR
jgi:hypothetical protein